MAFYGFEHRYGSNVRDEDGDLIGTLFTFANRAKRDAWVAAGNPYLEDPGARTGVRSEYAAKWQRISAAVETAR